MNGPIQNHIIYIVFPSQQKPGYSLESKHSNYIDYLVVDPTSYPSQAGVVASIVTSVVTN